MTNESIAVIGSTGVKDAGAAKRLSFLDHYLTLKGIVEDLLDTDSAASCCCGSGRLPKDQLKRVTEALDGKVASIRVVGRKPDEILP